VTAAALAVQRGQAQRAITLLVDERRSRRRQEFGRLPARPGVSAAEGRAIGGTVSNIPIAEAGAALAAYPLAQLGARAHALAEGATRLNVPTNGSSNREAPTRPSRVFRRPAVCGAAH
jgi:hypothetical protein